MYLEFLQEARDDKEKVLLEKSIPDDKFKDWVMNGLEKAFNLTNNEEDDKV